MSDYLLPVVSGFSGAFFAYVFVRITDFAKAIIIRKHDHLRSLRNLHLLFVDLGNGIHFNVEQIQDYLGDLKRQEGKEEPIYSIYRPYPLDVRNYSIDGLKNLDLLNDVIHYKYKATELNSILNSFCKINDLYRDKSIGNPDFHREYIEHTLSNKEIANFLLALHLDLQEHNRCIFERISKVASRDDFFLNRYFKSLVKSCYPDGLIPCFSSKK